MEPLIKVKKHAPSGTIILNRPSKGNALSRAMLTDLLRAFEDFHLEKQVRAVVLTGAGSAFCAGADLSEMQQTSKEEHAQAQWYHDAVQYKELVEFMLRFPKPIIAAVNGPAVAGGAGLVLASDIVVAASEASLGFPEPRRGLVSGLVAPLLVFRIGAGSSTRLLLSAETINSEQAHRLDLFHELVSQNQVWARAHEFAEQCARSAPEALQLTKRLINETIGEHLGVLLSAGAAATATARTTEAAAEGIGAFLESREPKWM